MHCLDLGVYQVIVACCLLEVSLENLWEGATQQERLLNGYQKYKQWCRTQSVEPCHRFSLKKLTPEAGNCPALTQRQAKPSQTRYLVRWLDAELQAQWDGGCMMPSFVVVSLRIGLRSKMFWSGTGAS